MKLRTTLLGAIAVTLATPMIALAGTVIQTTETAAGVILADADIMSLYTFDNDTAGVSNCNDGCAVKWPPLEATNRSRADGEFGIIIRADGSRQWAYQGMPLYTWFKDAAVGDTTGDGVKGVWHQARP